jgi:hypothetical protein
VVGLGSHGPVVVVGLRSHRPIDIGFN